MWAGTDIRVVQTEHDPTTTADPGPQLALLATDDTCGGPGGGSWTSVFVVANVEGTLFPSEKVLYGRVAFCFQNPGNVGLGVD